MKYPYIGKWEYINTTVIFTGENTGIEIGGEMSFRDDWTEINYENITREYLANTYGEVKSKEHAEFIVKLAEVNDIEVWGDDFINNDTCAFVCHRGVLEIHNHRCSKTIIRCKLKQITIPLPPECESVDEWPKVGDEVTWGTKTINGEIRGIDGNLAWIRNDHGNYVTAYISELEKPKTPEQELRDELSDLAFN